MTAKILGNFPPCKRFISGLYSLDRAFQNRRGDIGMPIGKGYEIFGQSHTGKSTFVYSLSALIGKYLSKDIILGDLEGFDPDFLLDVLNFQGFEGNIYPSPKDMDEDILMEIIEKLKTPEYSIGILDSIGAISPIAEQEGDLGSANMGRRALLMAQFTRKCLPLVREPDSEITIFMINHWYPVIGGRGWQSPGGEIKKYLAAVRILLKRKEECSFGSYVLEGKVVKNRYGYKNRLFYVFVLAGKGIHQGLSWLYDGILLEKVSRKKVIKIGDNSFGYFKAIIEQAQDGNDEFFEPFREALYETTEENNSTS